MVSVLKVICNHVHYKAFDHVNICKAFKCLFISDIYIKYGTPSEKNKPISIEKYLNKIRS